MLLIVLLIAVLWPIIVKWRRDRIERIAINRVLCGITTFLQVPHYIVFSHQYPKDFSESLSRLFVDGDLRGFDRLYGFTEQIIRAFDKQVADRPEQNHPCLAGWMQYLVEEARGKHTQRILDFTIFMSFWSISNLRLPNGMAQSEENAEFLRLLQAFRRRVPVFDIEKPESNLDNGA
ncbi:Hypothetical protein D9617_6g093150 [Elsinoe fawcettii]|nr:Hypothetical protein D9617_6g093150 [Elsinoe fawcettii]